MAGLSRVGDTNGVGGTLTNAASTVFINGKPAALHVSPITPHSPFGRPHPPHASSKTTGGVTSTVFIEGKPAVMKGTSTSCGHSIADGSGDVFGS
jgi:uncharacterized Zn-binding protein involved in type VI secretion